MSKPLSQERNVNGAEQQRSCWHIIRISPHTPMVLMQTSILVAVWFSATVVISLYTKDWFCVPNVVLSITALVLIVAAPVFWLHILK